MFAPLLACRRLRIRHAALAAALALLGYALYVSAQVLVGPRIVSGVLLWWTPFVGDDRVIECGNRYQCTVTENRNRNNVKAILFYGSDFEPNDLPRKTETPWALYHEESPKNLALLTDTRVQKAFDITSTFSRHSTLPLTLEYLQNKELLISTKHYNDLIYKNKLQKELAPVLYIQSDCDTPIQRDVIVEELMKYVKVDSYGKCLNNKQLPEKFKLNGTYDLYQEEFMKFVAQYKFVISIENSRCEDYITEKLWRPIIVGSVPIYLGSPSIKDWLPNPKSAILLDDFPTIKALADHIKKVNNDDDLYLSHLEHKTKSLITNERLIKELNKGDHGIEHYGEYTITAFECFVCEKMATKDYKKPEQSIYDCEEPRYVPGGEENFWIGHWLWEEERAKKLVKKLKL